MMLNAIRNGLRQEEKDCRKVDRIIIGCEAHDQLTVEMAQAAYPMHSGYGGTIRELFGVSVDVCRDMGDAWKVVVK